MITTGFLFAIGVMLAVFAAWLVVAMLLNIANTIRGGIQRLKNWDTQLTEKAAKEAQYLPPKANNWSIYVWGALVVLGGGALLIAGAFHEATKSSPSAFDSTKPFDPDAFLAAPIGSTTPKR